MQIRFGKKEAMDILIRHTLNCVLRNPVQSLIVVASTAVITACILVCLCISSLFEQLAGLKAGTWYAGADLYVSALTTHAKEVADYTAGFVFSVLFNRVSTGIARLINKFVRTELLTSRTLIIAAAGAGIFIVLWTVSHMPAFARASSDKYRTHDDRMLRSE